MTNEKANEALRTKYPEGSIWRDGNKICMTYKAGGRVYSYSRFSAYEGLLQHLGIRVASMATKRELEALLEGYRAEHGTVRESLFGRGTRVIDNAKRIANIEETLANTRFI